MRFAVAVVFLLAGSALHAQQAPGAIALDVVVDDGGQRPPLTASDFAVSEGGQPIAIESARLVQPSTDSVPLPGITTDDDEEAAAAAATRLVGIYIDEYHLTDGVGFASARAAVAAFVRRELGPRDLVVVLKPLDSLVSIRMTTDRERAAAIIEGTVARQGDYVPRSLFEQNFIAGAPARIDAARNQIALSSLSALAAHLGRFPAGRKTLIVVSNGFAAHVPSSRGDQPLPGLDSIVRAANRSRVAIYAIRPSPDRAVPVTREVADSRAATADPLVALATQTTGFVIDGGDVAAVGLQRVLRDASRYYLLMLVPHDLPPDGRFRDVSVAVRRPGAIFRARAGYSARRAAAPSASPRRSSLPEGLRIPRRSTTLIRTWFGQSEGDSGRTRVEFVWEPAPRVPGERGLAATPSRVSVAVTTMEGAPVFSGVSSPTGQESVVASSGHPQLSFETSPGALLVQMDVLDAAGRVLDHDVRDLVVGGFPGPLSFGTAAVYRARTVRELRALSADGGVVAPVASRQFSRAEHLVVRIPVVTHGGDATVTARLRSGFGNALRELPVTPLGTADVVQVDLPLAPLASGSYALEFVARSSRGSALDRLDFVVTP